jgi:SAM domain (Sterile alpha motif)
MSMDRHIEMEIGDWLARLGLPQYAKAFAENAIDTEVVRQLTAEDLKELGVELLGHRRKLLTAIEGLRSGVGSTSSARAEQQPASAVATTVISPERRHLTVLFCELVGSAGLAARLDPEDLRDVVRRYHSVVTDSVGAQDGFVAMGRSCTSASPSRTRTMRNVPCALPFCFGTGRRRLKLMAHVYRCAPV